MQVLSSLKEAKKRHRDCQIVHRRGRVYAVSYTHLTLPTIYSV